MSDKASLQRGAFLFCLSHTGNLTIAADFAGTTRAMMMAQMAADEGFALLGQTPHWFQWACMASIGASFGLRGFNRFQLGTRKNQAPHNDKAR